MQTYKVTIVSTGVPIENDYEVEAENEEDAKQIALDQARDDKEYWMPELEAKDATELPEKVS